MNMPPSLIELATPLPVILAIDVNDFSKNSLDHACRSNVQGEFLKHQLVCFTSIRKISIIITLETEHPDVYTSSLS